MPLPNGAEREREEAASLANGLSVGRERGFSRYVLPLSVLALTLVSFLPSLQSGFLRWSDYETLVQNPEYRGLTWHHFRWMFTTFHLGNYRPLTWMTFGFDYTFWGMNPFGYHLTSLLLHGINSVLVYFIAVRLLSLALPVSAASASANVKVAGALAALLFSVHPLRCEPVLWLSGRSHLLAALFFLLTIVCYLRAAESVKKSPSSRAWLVVAMCLYTLSLLSQPSEIALPLVLLILDVCPLKRLGSDPRQWFAPEVRRVWWEKTPFFVLAIGGGLIGLLAKKDGIFPAGDLTVLRRAALVLYGLAFYAWKTIIPVGLSPVYEVRFNFDPLRWPFLISGLAVLVISVLVFAVQSRWPAGVMSWFYYLLIVVPYVGFVLPVLGSFQNGRQITADRYSYLALLPWGLLAGASLHVGWRTWLVHRRGLGALILGSFPFVAIVITLMGLTWRQAQVWHDSYSLWKHAVEVTDRSPFESVVAHDHLGVALAEQGKFEEAITQFSEALRISPYFAQAHNNLGAALAKMGKLDEAIAQLSEAVRITPGYTQAHYNLGTALLEQGKLDEAVKQFSLGLGAAPTAQMHYQVAVALARGGKIQEAIGELQVALKLDPGYQPARRALESLTASGGK